MKEFHYWQKMGLHTQKIQKNIWHSIEVKTDNYNVTEHKINIQKLVMFLWAINEEKHFMNKVLSLSYSYVVYIILAS